MTIYISILVAILAFSLIVVAHELGHLMAAKKSGVYVIEFAVGMGPKLVSKQLGETVYSIRLLPIGGFCKMLGDEEENSDPRALSNKPPLKKFFVITAGSVMNFILGLVLIFAVTLMSGYTSNEIARVGEEQPAYAAGIRAGDEIVSINGRKTLLFEDILFAMNFSGLNKGGTVNVVFRSNGELISRDIVPEVLTTTYGEKTYERFIIGVSPKPYTGVFGKAIDGIERATLTDSVKSTFYQFRFYVMSTYQTLYMLVSGQVSLSELSGVIGIGGVFVESIEEPIKAVEEAKSEGIDVPDGAWVMGALINVMEISILITVNLGIMNLLPFPALDGGRAVFIILEGIRRKPINQEKEGMIHFAGFVLLMLLMVFVTYNDVIKLFVNG